MTTDRDGTFEFSKTVPPWGRIASLLLLAVCIGLTVTAIWTGDDSYCGFAILAGFFSVVLGTEFKIKATR